MMSENAMIVRRYERNRQRAALAAELVKKGLEALNPERFPDCSREVVKGGDTRTYDDTITTITLRQWFLKLAEAADAAASVLYPELPEENPERGGVE